MVSVRMEHAYHSSVMETGLFKEKLCLKYVCWSPSGTLGRCFDQSRESMGCFGKMFLGWIGAFWATLLFGTWGPIIAGTAIIPAILGAMIDLSYFLETRKLIS